MVASASQILVPRVPRAHLQFPQQSNIQDPVVSLTHKESREAYSGFSHCGLVALRHGPEEDLGVGHEAVRHVRCAIAGTAKESGVACRKSAVGECFRSSRLVLKAVVF